jgi:8-oxo-dGTP pyrophosphatase MutT (NUDIX family)
MRLRESARLLVISPGKRVLLFRFVHTRGALAGKDYWATPGGGLEAGETYQQAAIRELKEETGFQALTLDEQVLERQFPLQLPDGETVLASERYFVVNVDGEKISREGWTAQEVAVMTDYWWWSHEELLNSNDVFYPQDLPDLLKVISDPQGAMS